MASNPPPNPNRDNDEDWEAPDTRAGRWEGDAASSGDGKKRSGNALSGLWADPRSRPLLLISGLALLGIIGLACFILALVLLGDRGSLLVPGPGPDSADVTRPAITATLVVRVNDTDVPAAMPSKLSIGSEAFDVLPLTLNGTQLDYDPNRAKTAYWMPGTLVNYVIGVHASSENKPIIESLRPGDLVTLDTNVGTQRFRVTQQATVNDDDVSVVMAQDSPRLTLLLMGEGGSQRRVVLAQFTDEGTANQLTSVGTVINLGDVRVSALNQRLLPGNSVGLPAGKNYFQVDFEVTSMITDILDAAQFYTELSDGAGNVYVLSPNGSSANGAAGFSKGALQAGQTLTATAGFEVPSTMPGPTLEWRFALAQGQPEIARVAIPYRPILAVPTSEPTKTPNARITIVGANINAEGTEVRIVGTAQNLTQQFLAASLTDVKLSSESGQLFPLQSALPAFPWNIQPGETLTFQLAFVRPQGAGSVIFTMFGQSFKISGL
jgi:hypothetical protein